VCCLFHFLLHSTFFKGKVKNGIFGGFYCFLSVFFRVLLVGSNYTNTEDNYGRSIEFLSQISELS